jgi:hypothetical protein
LDLSLKEGGEGGGGRPRGDECRPGSGTKPKFLSLHCDAPRGGDIESDAHTDDDRDCPIEAEDKDEEDGYGLEDTGDEGQEEVRHEIVTGRATAIEDAEDGAGLLADVPMIGQCVDVLKGLLLNENIGSLLHRHVDKGLHLYQETKSETERERGRDRDRETETETESETERDRDRDRDRETETERQRERMKDKDLGRRSRGIS